MFLHLWNVRGWHENVSCVPTALCAVSACDLNDIGRVLQKAARCLDSNIPEQLQRDYNINIWLRAIVLLGGRWREVRHWSGVPYAQRPPVDRYMADFPNQPLELIFCENAEDAQRHETHVFARREQMVVDTYTRGAIQKFSGVPADYQPFRVKRAFEVEPA
jgi:hypothetical protein